MKLEDLKISYTLGGSGEGIPKEREVNKRREVFEWEVEREVLR